MEYKGNKCVNASLFILSRSALFLDSTQIPEYCRALEENEISDHCFDLIFAFDEIVALGYRENVNLAQIRTFTEMDSHEEKVFRAVREVKPTLSQVCLVPSICRVSESLWAGLPMLQDGCCLDQEAGLHESPVWSSRTDVVGNESP